MKNNCQQAHELFSILVQQAGLFADAIQNKPFPSGQIKNLFIQKKNIITTYQQLDNICRRYFINYSKYVLLDKIQHGDDIYTASTTTNHQQLFFADCKYGYSIFSHKSKRKYSPSMDRNIFSMDRILKIFGRDESNYIFETHEGNIFSNHLNRSKAISKTLKFNDSTLLCPGPEENTAIIFEGENDKLFIYNYAEDKIVKNIYDNSDLLTTEVVYEAALSPDNQKLACITSWKISIYDLISNSLSKQIDKHNFDQHPEYSPDSRYFAVANNDSKYIKIFDTENDYQLVDQLKIPNNRFRRTPYAFTSDSRKIVCYDDNFNLRIYDFIARQDIKVIPSSDFGKINEIIFLSPENLIITFGIEPYAIKIYGIPDEKK